jgi:hypothetical protein
MKKRFAKYLLILFVLAAGTMIWLYAQNGYLFRKPEQNTRLPDEEQGEDIGVPTGDDPWKEMDKLVTTYYDKQGISFKGKIKLIDDNAEQEKVIEEHSFEYTVAGENFHYKLGQIEVVNKKDLVLVADHSNKFISVAPVMSAREKPKKFFDITEFKKILEEQKADAKVTQLGEQKILTIENIQDPQIQGYRIYYDPLTYRISKMLIGMVRLSPLSHDEGGIEELPTAIDEKEETVNTGPNTEETGEEEIETYTYYMEIIYSEMKVMGIKEAAFHPENRFFVRSKNKIELTPAYSSYQLISNGETEKEKTNTVEEE